MAHISSDELTSRADSMRLVTTPRLTLTDAERFTVDRFCDQCLQLEPRPHYPDGNLLKRDYVQDEIFHRICADREQLPPGNIRQQLCILKELSTRIEASIRDEEANEYVRAFLFRSMLPQIVLC